LLNEAVAVMVVVRWMTLPPQEEVAVAGVALALSSELVGFLLRSLHVIVGACAAVIV
jgi:hypothetical protein